MKGLGFWNKELMKHHESEVVRQADLLEMQGGSPSGRGPGLVREPATQTAARLGDVVREPLSVMRGSKTVSWPHHN